MEYILFVHGNSEVEARKEEWDNFFEAARSSGIFRGGSEIGNRILLGTKDVPNTTDSIAGYMLFESDSINDIKLLLELHPVYIAGGSLELCELPKS